MVRVSSALAPRCAPVCARDAAGGLLLLAWPWPCAPTGMYATVSSPDANANVRVRFMTSSLSAMVLAVPTSRDRCSFAGSAMRALRVMHHKLLARHIARLVRQSLAAMIATTAVHAQDTPPSTREKQD